MKPELSEKILVEEIFKKTLAKKLLPDIMISNIEKLTGDASTRKYYRVSTAKNSYVACLDGPLKDDTEEPVFLKLQKVLNEEGIRVPSIFDKDLSTGYILEEDLGDITFLKEIVQIDDLKLEYLFYQSAINNMAKIHKININKYSKEVFTNLSFDTEKLFAEMEFTKKYFLKSFLGVDINSNTVELLYKNFYDLCFSISKEPKVIVHRDYHSRNIMIKNNEQVIIDFQDARLGTPLYDLVSLLEDCYYQLNVENKNNLINYYFENYFKKFDSTKSFEEFLVLYNKMAIQRIYKAIGSFAYIYAERKDLRYIKYIGFAFEKLRNIMLSDRVYDLERKILSSFYYAN